MTGMTSATVIAGAESDDPSRGLQAVVVLRRLTDRLEETRVRSARADGWTWQQIGDALGVSRQAVHKKYGR